MPNARRVLLSPLLWLAVASSASAGAAGCSAAATTPGCDGGSCNDGSAPAVDAGVDAGEDAQPLSDASHDGPPPDALYGACAIKGSFGSPCTLTTSGADPQECTDPNYPQCFVGGQGAWCTKKCNGATDCMQGTPDAGCIPAACNPRGFCK